MSLDYNKMEQRYKFLQFIKLGDMEAFKILGVGVSDLSMEYSGDEESYRWVTQKNGKTINRGYEVTSGVEQLVHSDDPVFSAIDAIRRKLGVGAEASGEIVNVFAYEEEDDFPTTAPAEKWDVSITINSFGGGAEDGLTIGYTINYNGTPVEGNATIDYEDKEATFTESQI